MKYILNVLKLPTVCGIAVYDSFDKCNGGDYTVPNITPYDRLIGYHAVLITGYTEDKFEVLNSYGPFFGDRGYFYLTNEWVLMTHYVLTCGLLIYQINIFLIYI